MAKSKKSKSEEEGKQLIEDGADNPAQGNDVGGEGENEFAPFGNREEKELYDQLSAITESHGADVLFRVLDELRKDADKKNT